MGEKSQPEECLRSPRTRTHSGNNREFNKTVRRTTFTPQQLYYLEEKFVQNQFPDADQREKIAGEINLTMHHIQVWFQNKRAKVRRKLKKMEIDKSKVHVPKPPSFWPQHLPFDSNLTEILNDSDNVHTTRMSSSSRHASGNMSLTKVTVNTSISHIPSSNPAFSTSTLESASSLTISNSSSVQSSCNFSTASKTLTSPNKYPDYCQYPPITHFSLCANVSNSTTEVSHLKSHQSMCFEGNQPLASFEDDPSSCCTKYWYSRTTLPMDSSPTRPPQYHEQSLYNTRYTCNNAANFKHCRVEQNQVDKSSLLLLADCATLTSATPQIGMQNNPFLNISEVPESNLSVLINTTGTQLPSLCCARPAQMCETIQDPPAISSSTSLMGAEDESMTSTLQLFSTGMPTKLPSGSTPGINHQDSYSAEVIQKF